MKLLRHKIEIVVYSVAEEPIQAEWGLFRSIEAGLGLKGKLWSFIGMPKIIETTEVENRDQIDRDWHEGTPFGSLISYNTLDIFDRIRDGLPVETDWEE